MSCLGEPIKHQGFKLGDTQYATEDAQFILKVKGPNDNGKELLRLRLRRLKFGSITDGLKGRGFLH